MKKVLLICMVMILTILGACNQKEESQGGNESDSNSEKKNVAILTPYLSSVTTKEMVTELESSAKEKGWSTNVIDTNGDVGLIASRMEDVISSKVDSIIIVSTDPNQLKQQIEKANEQGIPVFGVDSGYIEGMTLNVTSDNVEMSRMITEYLVDQMGGKGNLIVFTHRPHPGLLKRTQLLEELLADSDINVISDQEIQVPGPIENARQQMENLLLANQEEGSITAVWAGWDEPAIGAAQAIESVGREGIIVTGIDGNSQAVEMIKKGSPLKATIKQNFIGMAQIAIEQMEIVFTSGTIEGTEMYAPAELITAE